MGPRLLKAISKEKCPTCLGPSPALRSRLVAILTIAVITAGLTLAMGANQLHGKFY